MTLSVPAEHAPHASCWLAYPYRDEEWTDLTAAQAEHADLVRAIAETEPVELLCAEPPAELAAVANVRFHAIDYGDAWTRDTAPIFAARDGELVALTFHFNGWGGKYLMDGDTAVAGGIAELSGARRERHDFVLEGGAVEFDGEGTVLTTGCIDLPNRTPPSDMEQRIRQAFGAEALLRIEGQLAGDHTDGHIDTLVRFVRPGEVVCMRGQADDPNGAMLLAIEEQLHQLTDAQGRRLLVHTIPAPGAVVSDGELLAASYCNYYLANGQVLVPLYGSAHDDAALGALTALFPERRVRGLRSRAIIEGGGSFHCMTQQQPAL